eukprot:EC826238.1.p1 GENE.EC826238.1~~EC826238.1.p1  ORF type:complete len:186 (+),score=62.66 EC826238.1:139-696(+)
MYLNQVIYINNVEIPQKAVYTLHEEQKSFKKKKNISNNFKSQLFQFGTLKKKLLSESEIKKYMHLPQKKAAQLLGVSVSTLKRRFYELKISERWPYGLKDKTSYSYKIVKQKNVNITKLSNKKIENTNNFQEVLKDKEIQNEVKETKIIRNSLPLNEFLLKKDYEELYLDDETKYFFQSKDYIKI